MIDSPHNGWKNEEAMDRLLDGRRYPRNLSEDKFVPWFHSNDRFCSLFDQFTRQLIAAGKKRYSCYSVAHRIRWEVEIATRAVGDDFEAQFKVSNTMIPYVARVWQERNPEFGNFFGLKRIKCAPAPKGFASRYFSKREAARAEALRGVAPVAMGVSPVPAT